MKKGPFRRLRRNDASDTSPALREVERSLTWVWSTPRAGAELLLQLVAHPLRPDRKATMSFRPPPSKATTRPHVVPIDELCFGTHFAPWPGDIVERGESLAPGTVLDLSETDDPYLLSRYSEPIWREPLRNLLLSRVAAARSRAADHVRGIEAGSPVVIKEVTSSYAAVRVMSLTPAAGMIALVRDPRDVVLSRVSHPDALGDPEPLGTADRAAEVEHAARLWAMSVDVLSAAISANAAEGPGRSILLRYEDLLRDPAAALAGSLEIAGVARDPDAVSEAVDLSWIGSDPPDREPLEHDLSTPVGAWQNELTTDEIETVERIAGGRLETLGYDRRG